MINEDDEAVTEGPAWWRGDDEASQSFLTSMGVKF